MVFFSYTLSRPSPLLNEHLSRKYHSLLPSRVRKNAFSDLYKNIKKIIRSQFFDARLISYGSHHAGVSLEESDLDLSLILDTEDVRETAYEIARLLQKNGFKKPRVARAKGKYTLFGTSTVFRTRIKYDMSINNFSGPLVSSIVSTAASNHILARQLMILVKEFIMVQKLHSPKKGFLSSVAYCYLCIVVMQEVKILSKFQDSDLKQFEELLKFPPRDLTNTKSGINLEVSLAPRNSILFDLFYRFFRFYVYEFDFDEYAVSVTRSKFAKKADLGWPHSIQGRVVQENLTVIENPFERENLGKSITFEGLRQIRLSFGTACDLLRNGSPVEQVFNRFEDMKMKKMLANRL